MVALRSAHAPPSSAKTATLTAVRETTLSVTLDEHPEDDELSEPLTLCMLHNDVSYRRCQQALDAVRQGRGPAAALREALLARRRSRRRRRCRCRRPRSSTRGSTRVATPSPLRSPRGPSPASTGRRAPASDGGRRARAQAKALASDLASVASNVAVDNRRAPPRRREAAAPRADRPPGARCRAAAAPDAPRARRPVGARVRRATELDAAQKKARRARKGARALRGRWARCARSSRACARRRRGARASSGRAVHQLGRAGPRAACAARRPYI